MEAVAATDGPAVRNQTYPPPSYWRETLAPYSRPNLRKSLLDIATSIVPYLALTAAMYAVRGVSAWLVLALAIPASGFLVRTFIVFHDCTHGSFLPSRKWNARVGMLAGLLVYSPFHSWRYEHAVHHATAGDLDSRGTGDVETLTVAEYLGRSRGRRLEYRLFRNPLIMLGVGPIWALMIEPRMVPKWARKRFARHILATDVVLFVVIGALVALFGWQAVLLVQLPTAMLAGATGIWLFYVQHQFEDVYWENKGEWNYAAAALEGSSYLKLPKVLQFFSGNIGLHHVHHLSARIPNYNLQAAHDENPVFHQVPVLTGWEGVKALRLKLYDEDSNRLIGWNELREVRTERNATRTPASATA
jgi:omega-6 fatty acid desaturase (delta-12 desaturase)